MGPNFVVAVLMRPRTASETDGWKAPDWPWRRSFEPSAGEDPGEVSRAS
jgi:hypothetical protein